MENFTISLDKICFLIEKAHEFEVSPPSENLGGDEAHTEDLDVEKIEAEGLELPRDEPGMDELSAFFENLNDDEGLDLVTLMWIGRGTYESGDWLEARDVANKEATHSVADYLLGTPLLGEHLENGLEAFGLTCGN